MNKSPFKEKFDNFSRIIFVCNLYILAFVAGLACAVLILNKSLPDAHIVLEIRSFVEKAMQGLSSRIHDKHIDLALADFFPGKSGITVSTHNVQPGYILISRLSAEKNQFVVELMDKTTGEIIHTWAPSYEELYKNKSIPFDSDDPQSVYNMNFRHPLLMEDGSIIIMLAGERLARIDKNSHVVWQLKHFFHHAINRDHEGNIWVQSKIKPSHYKLHPPGCPLLKNRYEQNKIPIREEVLIKLSPDGEILKEISLLDILLKNNLKHTFVSMMLSDVNNNPTHLNDIEPVLEDSHFAKKGDLFLSMREINLILLYRPSTNKVIWHKAGPWIAQHDVTINNSNEISVLSNGRPLDPYDKTLRSRIFVYNFKKDTVSEPYAKAIDKAQFYIWAQGIQTILPNGNILLEETARGRILELSTDSVEWEYVNRYSKYQLGQLGWVRFLPSDSVNLDIFNK